MARGKRRHSVRREVELTRNTPRSGKPRLWAFGFDELGELLGVRPLTARRMFEAGTLDPADLSAVCALWLAHRKG